jgi:hypothetical protein
MKNTYITLFVLLLFIQVGFAQKRSGKIQPKKSTANASVEDDSLLRLAVKIKVEEAGKALFAGDYENLFNLTHPKVQQIMGGRDKFIAHMSQEMKAMEADGLKFAAMETNEPERIVKVGNQMFAIVPIKLRLQTPKGIFVQEAFDVGVSDNKGKTWLLIGGSGNGGKESFRRLFPMAADKLNFPEHNPPYPYNGQ